VVFKGREITYQAIGREVLDRFTERISDIAKLEQDAKLEGRQLVAIFVADKTKKRAPETSKK